MINSSAFIHPSSIVDEGATVGAETKIWHFCHLMPSAVVGAKCIIGQNVFIDNNAVIGNGVKIQNNVSVYNGLRIADDVFVGPSVVFTNVINPRSFVERKQEFKETWIEKGASLGANSTILCGIRIGAFALIGAGAIVNRNIPNHALIVGNPGKHIGWISCEGHALDFSNGPRYWCAEEYCFYINKNGIVEKEASV